MLILTNSQFQISSVSLPRFKRHDFRLTDQLDVYKPEHQAEVNESRSRQNLDDGLVPQNHLKADIEIDISQLLQARALAVQLNRDTP